MKIELELLEECIMTIFHEMKSQNINTINLESDFYWNVPSESIYDIYKEPIQLDVGQLEDDYKTLCQAKEKDILVRHNLKSISAILRYIAEKSFN
ncbi:hypothetical protein ABN063_06570 [Providencia vermicola]|uniref:hypothetical protein n=1 Tax=Providencia vermicola TaxID=333965 RepID=UPI0032DBC202